MKPECFQSVNRTIILHNVKPVMGYYYSNRIRVKLCLFLLLNDTFIWVIIVKTIAWTYIPQTICSLAIKFTDAAVSY